ncbi:MAG: tetratricopeptide repeat protein [Chloroflexia bacterium]
MASLSPQHNLPSRLTSFIGREREIEDITRALDSARLLTLTGPGGSGKTSLSIEAAWLSLDAYPDGVWFVELAALTDPALVAPEVALVLGLRNVGDSELATALVRWLESRKVLIVLDNCEHLIRTCSSLTDTLLRSCPQIHMLATSRQILNISGEVIWRVPSLSFPDPHHPIPLEKLRGYDAIQLFVERARLRDPAFKLAPTNAPAVTQLCYGLDGLPLAIELAAAHVGTIQVEDIAAQLEEQFRSRTDDKRAAHSRQHTLRATIDWSYDLLAEPEQRLLRALAVFAGSFSPAAVEQVCTEESAGAGRYDGYKAIDILCELVDRSLLIEEAQNGEARYHLLDTIRQYAIFKLRATEAEEEASLRMRHLLWCRRLAEEAAPHLQIADQAVWLDRLQADYDNMRAALQWGRDTGIGLDSVSRLATALGWFWYVRGYASEGRQWLGVAIKSDTLPSTLRAIALNRAGLLARSQGDYESATTLFAECLEIYRNLDDKKHIAATLINLGVAATNTGEYALATNVLKEALALKEEIGDLTGKATALNNLANIAADQGDFKEAGRYFEQCVAIQKEAGNKFMLAVSLNNLGNIASCLGEYAKARELVTESLKIKRELGDKIEVASSLHKLANIEWYERNYAEAGRLCHEGMATLRDTGDREATALILNTLGEIARCQGNYAEARARYEEARSTSRERWVTNDALYNLGHLALHEDDYKQAEARLGECLQSYLHICAKKGLAQCLACAGRFTAAHAFPKQAAKLFGSAAALFDATGYQMHSDDQSNLKQSHASVRAQLGKNDWAHAWAEGRSMPAESAAALAVECMRTALEAEAAGVSRKAGKRAPKYPKDLTQREVEVLRLVAEGLTDARIASSLSISPNTVHAHLRSTYDKLGVTTRSAAARFAAEHGLD